MANMNDGQHDWPDWVESLRWRLVFFTSNPSDAALILLFFGVVTFAVFVGVILTTEAIYIHDLKTELRQRGYSVVRVAQIETRARFNCDREGSAFFVARDRQLQLVEIAKNGDRFSVEDCLTLPEEVEKAYVM
ncbi:MAG: hypothetical protein AAFY15_04590, partial [Cyanobacteria bacterium J06648_11]